MPTLLMDIDRIQDGQEVVKNILVRYTDDYPDQLPILHIESGWQPKKKAFKDKTDYTLEEFPCSSADFVGRGFRLVKTTNPDDVYDVFLSQNGQDHHCSCAGGTYNGKCKHLSSLLGLLAAGYLDEPHAYEPQPKEYVDSDYEYVF